MAKVNSQKKKDKFQSLSRTLLIVAGLISLVIVGVFVRQVLASRADFPLASQQILEVERSAPLKIDDQAEQPSATEDTTNGPITEPLPVPTDIPPLVPPKLSALPKQPALPKKEKPTPTTPDTPKTGKEPGSPNAEESGPGESSAPEKPKSRRPKRWTPALMDELRQRISQLKETSPSSEETYRDVLNFGRTVLASYPKKIIPDQELRCQTVMACILHAKWGPNLLFRVGVPNSEKLQELFDDLEKLCPKLKNRLLPPRDQYTNGTVDGAACFDKSFNFKKT